MLSRRSHSPRSAQREVWTRARRAPPPDAEILLRRGESLPARFVAAYGRGGGSRRAGEAGIAGYGQQKGPNSMNSGTWQGLRGAREPPDGRDGRRPARRTPRRALRGRSPGWARRRTSGQRARRARIPIRGRRRGRCGSPPRPLRTRDAQPAISPRTSRDASVDRRDRAARPRAGRARPVARVGGAPEAPPHPVTRGVGPNPATPVAASWPGLPLIPLKHVRPFPPMRSRSSYSPPFWT